MNSIEIAYQNALMSDAAYIDFDQDGFLSTKDDYGNREINSKAFIDFETRGGIGVGVIIFYVELLC